MLLKTLRGYVGKLPGQNGRLADTLSSIDDFSTMLKQERSRADRNKHELSLAVFDVQALRTEEDRISQLAHVLGERIRSMDTIGWLDADRIGVLLPYTHPDGAWKVVEDVRQQIAAEPALLPCEVYVYPSQWLPGKDRVALPPRLTVDPS